MLEHGGRLHAAARQYGIAVADWLDLSTGLNPRAYPVPPMPAEVWQRLPEDDDGLLAIAADYYRSRELLVTAGSQPALMALPALLPGTRVGLLGPLYAEHPHAWRHRAPRLLTHHPADAEAAARAVEDALPTLDTLLLVQPNNPTGLRFPRQRLNEWRHHLARRGGWLVVDEAFADAESDTGASLAPEAGVDGLVVLRSLGKFFGLAGARVGFVLAPAALREALAEHLGPWPVSGPGRHAARHALADQSWQAATRARLAHDSARLAALLTRHGLGPVFGPALFKYCPRADAAALQHALAGQGILTRRFDDPPALRIGLPGDEAAWARLDAALAGLSLPPTAP